MTKPSSGLRMIALLASWVLLVGCPARPGGPDITAPTVRHRYVSFPALRTETPLQVGGRLSLPVVTEGQKVPAVVIAHGSGGVDSRGGYYAQALNDAGIATLELDMWTARGLSGGADGRPKSVRETLPDAYGALKYLSSHPAIDGTRVGIMGFSWGGAMSMLTATRAVAEQMSEPGQRFVAHAPLYPVCWIYNRVPGYEFSELAEVKVLLQAGSADAYDEPDTCQKLVESLPEGARARVQRVVYPEATHAWDRLEPAMTVEDPMSHSGRGGPVDLIPSPGTAEQSRQAVVSFFQSALGLAP